MASARITLTRPDNGVYHEFARSMSLSRFDRVVGAELRCRRLISNPLTMPNIINITFKDEEEMCNEPVGPVTLTFADSAERTVGWRRLTEAQTLAERHGLTLERF